MTVSEYKEVIWVVDHGGSCLQPHFRQSKAEDREFMASLGNKISYDKTELLKELSLVSILDYDI